MTSRAVRDHSRLAVAVLAAAMGGVAIGVGLAQLAGDSADSTSKAGDPPVATTTTTTTTTTTRPVGGRTTLQKPANAVRVHILSAVLHPAATPSGQRRNRARLSVHVRVTNIGSRRFSGSRPVLLAGGARIKADPHEDSPVTTLRALGPGAHREATFRFEIAGTVTARVRQEGRVRVFIAGRRWTASVIRGAPVGAPTATGGSGSSDGSQTLPQPAAR